MEDQSDADKTLLEVRDLRTHFFLRRGVAKAVDGVSFTVRQGEALGLVGESGSGKSVTCLSIVRMVPSPPARIVGGEVLFDGVDILKRSEAQMRELRGRQIAMVLQDPMTSLNPVFTIGDQIAAPLRVHHGLRGGPLRERILEMLRLVSIASGDVRMRDYPHQMSGGMRQRVVLAIDLSCEPRLLIADEPTSSLDVTIQLQLLALLREIKEKHKLGIILVTHDLGIVAGLCDRVAVMYAGRIVETGAVRQVLANPAHPYTKGLVNSIPEFGRPADLLPAIEGEPADVQDLPAGCAFHPRCGSAIPRCSTDSPPATVVAHQHSASCWLLAAG